MTAMATPSGLTLITETEFRSSRYADVADNVVKLSSIIQQAEDYVEKYLDRKIAKAVYVEEHFQRQKYLFPRQYPVVAITDLKRRRRKSTEWEDLDLDMVRFVHPDAPILEYLGGDLSDYEVRIEYEAGYDPVPPAIKAAVILQTVLLSTVDIGVFGADDGQKPGYLYMQDEVHRYLDPYKRLRRYY